MNETELELVLELEKRLNFEFSDRALALAALTHRSWVNEHPGLGHKDNERLEFLGDAVIDLVVSERLMVRLPDATEGALSRMRAALVCADALADVAKQLGLGDLLRLGKGEELTGGRAKTSLLSNCFEAILGAIFLLDGLGAVHKVVDNNLISRIEVLRLDLSGGRDYKTILQEQAQSLLGHTPRYRVIDEQGPDHAKIFTVEVFAGEEVLGRGNGRSKKEAEQRGAADALMTIEKNLLLKESLASKGIFCGQEQDGQELNGGNNADIESEQARNEAKEGDDL